MAIYCRSFPSYSQWPAEKCSICNKNSILNLPDPTITSYLPKVAMCDGYWLQLQQRLPLIYPRPKTNHDSVEEMHHAWRFWVDVMSYWKMGNFPVSQLSFQGGCQLLPSWLQCLVELLEGWEPKGSQDHILNRNPSSPNDKKTNRRLSINSWKVVDIYSWKGKVTTKSWI